MDPNEKIQLEDISFDDVISGDGIETVPVVDELEPLVDEGEEEILDEDQSEPSEEEALVEDGEEAEDDEGDGSFNYKDENSDEEGGFETIVSEVLDKLGFEGDNEYADTAEGLAEMTSDIASQMADERIDDVLAKFPLVQKHLDYVLNGGESQNFMEAHDPNMDYEKLTIADNDHISQKAILGDYLEMKGHDKDFIQEMLEDFEDSGKLGGKAEAARKALANHQIATRSQMVEEQKQQTADKNQELEEFWGGVADTIADSDQFAGIAVPEREKEGFFEYLSSPVNKQGHTQRDVDHSEAALEKKLAIDYLMFKGFDLSGLIKSKAKTQNAKTLRDRLSTNEDQVKNTRRSSRKSKNVNFEDLDLSI